MKKEIVKSLVENLGQEYSEILGIKLDAKDDREIFKWFLAAILFGAPITEKSVIKTYSCFEKHDAITPRKILEKGWRGLVEILDQGSYTRYDFKTSDKLLKVMDNLVNTYHGELSNVHDSASDPADLERRLKSLGKGIGYVTVSIFLRELRNIWEKADPKPTPLVILAARELEITKAENPEEVLKDMKGFWESNKVQGKTFVNFETALLRFGKNNRRKKIDQSSLKNNLKPV